MDYKNRPSNLRPPRVTQSATYTGEIVERIYALSSRDYSYPELRSSLRHELNHDHMQFPTDLPPHFDDLVFLPANLTRLTIDAYRELCKVETWMGGDRVERPIHLATPVAVAIPGAGALSEEEGEAVLRAVRETGTLAIVGPAGSSPAREEGLERQILLLDEPAQAGALKEAPAGLVLTPRWACSPTLAKVLEQIRSRGICLGPLGVVLPFRETYAAMQCAAGAGVDFAIVNGSLAEVDGEAGGLSDEGWPRIGALFDAVRGLRGAGLEEEIDLVYHGGIRGGTDTARALCLGAKAVVITQAARHAMELGRKEKDRIERGTIDREGHVALLTHRLSLFIKSMETEATTIAKACGKTVLHNLEPEDMRALTAQTAAATGIPLVGRDLTFDAVGA